MTIATIDAAHCAPNPSDSRRPATIHPQFIWKLGMPETALYDIYEHDVRSPHERQHRSQTRRWPGRQCSGRHRAGPHRHRETHPAREEMDHLRRGQLRVRAAVHRGDSDLREIADARGRQHRVGLGLRADHRIAGHRAAHAAARLDCRRAGHENQVLPRLLRHRRRHVLRDGASTDVAAVPGRVYPRDDRTTARSRSTIRC